MHLSQKDVTHEHFEVVQRQLMALHTPLSPPSHDKDDAALKSGRQGSHSEEFGLTFRPFSSRERVALDQ